MVSLCIPIENDKAAAMFRETLQKASSVARDMLIVQTSIRQGTTIKTIQTKCPRALAMIMSSKHGRDGT